MKNKKISALLIAATMVLSSVNYSVFADVRTDSASVNSISEDAASNTAEVETASDRAESEAVTDSAEVEAVTDNAVSDDTLSEGATIESDNFSQEGESDMGESDMSDYDIALLGDSYSDGVWADVTSSEGPVSFDSIPDLDEVEAEAAPSSDKWDKQVSASSSSTFSVDDTVTYGNSAYSIKIVNNDYSYSTIGKKFTVKPNTSYRFSAMAKCSDIQKYTGEDSDKAGTRIGASLGEYWTYNLSRSYTDTDWKKLDYLFTTASDQAEIELGLMNGVWNSYNKGTVWYSDIKLEEYTGTKTNEWNILNIVLKNVDVKGITYNKKTIDYHETFDDADVAYLKEYDEHSASKFEEFSNGLMKVKSVDTVSTDVPITELANYDWVSDPNIESSYSIHAYRLDETSKCLSDIIDSYLDGTDKIYNMINLYAPLNGLAGDKTGTTSWLGLNGTYRNIPFTQMQYKSGSQSYKNDRESPAMVHEMLHQFEIRTQKSQPTMYVALHSRSLYDETYPDNTKWYTAYMRAEIEGSKGVDPSLYSVYNDGSKYLVVFESEQVVDPSLVVSSIELTPPTKTNYHFKETLDLTGASLKVTYQDGHTEDIDVTPEMLGSYDLSTAGTKSIPVYYKGKTASFNVVVSNEVPSVTTVANGEELTQILKMINNPLQDYTIELADNIQVSSLVLPKRAKSITLKGKTGPVVIRMDKSTIKSKYPLSFIDVRFETPMPVKITCGGALYLENVVKTGALSAKNSLTVLGDSTSIVGSVNVKGKNSELSMQNTDVTSKVSSAGNVTLKNCQLGSTLKAKGKFTAIGNVHVAKSVSVKEFILGE